MDTKWTAIIIFTWLIGILLNLTYEKDWAQAQEEFGTSGSGNVTTMERLFTPVETNYKGTAGDVKFWIASSEYWNTWLSVLTWNFLFLQPVDTNGDGDITGAEENNNDFGKYVGYFIRAFGIIGFYVFLNAMFTFLRGIVPW